MNKYWIIVVILVLVGVYVGIMAKHRSSSTNEFELTYDISAGIPFKWVYEIEDESVVEFVKSYVAKDENTDGKVGAKVYTTYVFKGLKEGETTITFRVVSITGEYEDSQIDVNKVKVDKDLNISLVNGDNE